MKVQTLKESLPAKIAAQFLLFLMTVSCFVSVMGVLVLQNVNAFQESPSRLQEMDLLYWPIMRDINTAAEYYTLMQEGDVSQEEVNEAFSPMNTNFSFMILDAEDVDAGEEPDILFASAGAGEAVAIATHQFGEVYVCGMLDENFKADDQYQSIYQLYQQLYGHKWGVVAAVPVTLLLAVLLFVYLLTAAGHQKGRGLVARPVDRIPLDLQLGVFALLGVGLVQLVVERWYYGPRSVISLIAGCLGIMAAYGLAVWMLLSLVRRLKAKGWWRNTVLAWIITLVVRGSKKCFGALRRFARWSKAQGGEMVAQLPLIWKVVLSVFGVVLFVAYVWYLAGNWRIGEGAAMVITVLLLAAALVVVEQLCSQLLYLKQVGARIAAGEEPVVAGEKAPRLRGLFQEHAENLGKVREGMELAVEAQLRSERLKTELITNVSHDIKTPLTSIINYVDLLRREEAPEQQRAYIEVLDKHAKRLKKLTEDLLEVSKATTGNVSVNFETVDLCESLNQAVGEYSERLEEAELKTVVLLPEHPVQVRADGKHMWRVLDNLLSNVCKYSLSGTRVYCTLKEERDRAQLQVKNVSKEPLNIDPDELMERFVRGDDARSTEGSGLGLSIARSLTQAQEGQFRLDIDGDLFKVTLTMPLID